MGLFDYEFRLEEINKKQPPLQKLNAVIEMNEEKYKEKCNMLWTHTRY